MKEQEKDHEAGEVQGRKEERQGQEAVEVTLRLPGPDERGFLRRIREVQAIMDLGRDGVVGTFAMWAAFANYLVDHGYVEAPPGVDPHEAMLDLTREELSRAFANLAGIEMPKAVDPPTGA